jgi:three-Cys-motif partner protein
VAESRAEGLEDDGWYAPVIKPHSLDKIALHNAYAAIFTAAMRTHWPQLAYLGLYSGPGRARLAASGTLVETSAMGAVRLAHPFTKYIFVDEDPRCIEALRHRTAALGVAREVSFIEKDVAVAVPDILAAMPRFSRDRGLLSFCFIDPFSAALDFDVIRQLGSRYKMDFLILLMLGRDIRTNFARYLADPNDRRIGALIDDPDWRGEWISRRLRARDVVPFIYDKFDIAMRRLGYEPARKEDAHPVRVAGKQVLLYSLVLYSKDELARKLWSAARIAAQPQYRLPL